MPLKRHTALQDYSREHHDELLLVWKIREGLKKGISAERITKYLLHHYQEETLPHMLNEETLILTKLPFDDSDRLKILKEHDYIKKSVSKLEDQATISEPFLAEIADYLEKHIRFEERVFFPRLQNEFPDDVVLSMQPPKSNAHCVTWNDLFWEKK